MSHGCSPSVRGETNHNYRDGFKAHIGIEPDTRLITAYELTAGNIGDAQAPDSAYGLWRRCDIGARSRRIPCSCRRLADLP